MGSLKGLKVLVIEDTEDLVNFHKRWLDLQQAVFFSSLTGQGGIDIFSENPDIDIIILDMVLPDISGDEVYEEIRKINPNVPIIVCSGYHDKIEKMSKKPKVKILYKPFLLPALIEMIQECCPRDDED